MAEKKNAWGYPVTNYGTAKVSRWWEQDMSDSGQGLFSDPQTGLQVGTMPQQLLQQQEKQEQDARDTRGGFLQNIISNISEGASTWDGALSNIPGWGVTKNVGKGLWYPVDKLASGAHWLYSNAISQPLSTLLIQTSKAELAEGGFWDGGIDQLMSGDEWEDAYGKAEHISPAQAFMNYENTMAASGRETALSFTAADENKISDQDRAQVKRQTERFLYDTEYWREKQGWTYTAGTGALDFMITMGADPTYAAIKVGSSAIKGARSIKVAEEGAELAPAKGISGVNMLADKAGQAIGRKLAKTPEEAAQSTKVNGFFDWAAGKSPAEIAQHPIWGRGRRVNPAKDQISQVLAHASREEMPLMFRFAMGDNTAAAKLVESNADLLAQIGKMSESRVLVDSAKFDSEIMGALKESTPGVDRFPMLTDIPPRPTAPGPRQSGWDKTYGELSTKLGFHREALAGKGGITGLGPAPEPSMADVLRAEEWKAAKLGEMDGQLAAMQEKSQYYGQALGGLPTKLEDFSPGASNIFGTAKSLYRQGPLALRSAETAADKNVAKLGRGKNYLAKSEAGFTSRIIRNGFYTAPIRVWQSFGERLPETFINHNEADAYERVADMLRQVPNLAPEARLQMVTDYSQAGDKIARADVLNRIHTEVVNHMVSRVNGLDEATSLAIDRMRQVGFTKAMNELTGQRPADQMYSAALRDQEAGYTASNRLDFVEAGEGHMIAPTAKSQLSYSEPLLNVRELDRVLKRNSAYLGSVGKWSRDRAGDVGAILDQVNTVWKAGTLLRPGYTLRSMSEEQVASATKFGVMATIMNLGEGGWNWARNRGNQLKAVVGKGSYVSASGEGGLLRITDEEGIKAAEALGLETERINISSAWPVVQGTLSEERSALKAAEDQINTLKADPKHDPAELAALQEKAADHQIIVNEFSDYATALLQEAKTSKGRRLGEGAFEHEGILVPQAFSTKWENPIPRDQITSARAMETVFARAEAVQNSRLIKTGDWAPITPGGSLEQERHHMESWLHGVNNQYGQDELYRIVASDPTLKAAKAWVKTPAGKHHMSQLGVRARDPEGTIDAIQRTLDAYLPRGTGLQDKLARGEQITETELRSAIAAEDFPTVHGEELKALTGKHAKNTASQIVDTMIEKGFKALSTVPNDIMARQPIYLRAQEARMKELISQELSYRMEMGLDDTLGVEDMNKLLEKSDKMARKDISQVVYDPTRTTATEALRFISPFLSAHMDGLQRWGGLIAEKPTMLTTAAKVYNAPVAANLVTDRMGRPIDQSGNITTEDGKKEFVPLADRVLTLRMPGSATKIKGVGEAVSPGGIRINMQSLNTILPGDPWWNPGVGPYAQYGLSKLAEQSPALGDFMQFAKILPYGPSENIGAAFTPAYMKDAWDAFTTSDPNNETYQRAFLAEIQRQQGVYVNGGDKPNLTEAAANAKEFVKLHALTNWLMPARNQDTPLTGTPFQFFIDQYKTMQEVDPKNAQENFMAKYGEDYFVFTAAMNKSMGIASTVSADATAKKYKDLIAQRPELASLIVGDVYNKGSFSNTVYKNQFNELIGGEKVRQKLTAEQAIAENKKSLGWQKYGQMMNTLDAALIRSGFKSYADRGAEQFQLAKRAMVDSIRKDNDAWYEDFSTVNRAATPLNIEAMKKITSDPDLMNDPMRSELHVLKQYIEVRDALKASLNARGQRSVSFTEAGMPTGDAQDIGYMLRQVQLMFMNNDTRFADVFHRYLENDDLT